MIRYVLVSYVLILSFLPLSAAPPTEGGKWLEWDEATKLVYVRANVTGYQRGFYEGCRVALTSNFRDTKSHDSSVDACRRKVQRHSKLLEYYVEAITRYYRTYPEDMNVAISDLLEAFSDSKDLTIQQVHEYYGPSAKKVPKD